MLGDKIRFRFRKEGVLRLLSHHDLMRSVERMLRRAAIPFKSTCGFHPSPRLVFALSLPLGVLGSNEVVEIELTEPCDSEEILHRLRTQSPAGLTFLSAGVIPMKARAVPRRAVYAFPLDVTRVEPTWNAIGDLLAADQVWVNRRHPKPRRVNIRSFLRNLEIVAPAFPEYATPAQAQGASRCSHALLLDIWVTAYGSARAEELVQLLGLADQLETGAVLERITLELHDETPLGAAEDGPPTGPPETAPYDHVTANAVTEDDPAPEATWGLSPNGPIVE